MMLVLLAGCGSQLTEAELEYRQYVEQERVVAYRAWRDACVRLGGTLYVDNPIKPCRKSTECIPDRHDWSHDRKHNRLQCVKWKR